MIIHAQYPNEKHPGTRSGTMIIEMTVALGLLSAIAYILLQGTLHVLPPRQWVIMQNVTDAYLTYEEAYAKRISFEELDSNADSWPIFPDTSSTFVVIGKSPGMGKLLGIDAPASERDITCELVRTRTAHDNLPDVSVDLGTKGVNPTAIQTAEYLSELSNNAAKMETWKLQSHLKYSIGGKDYVKSRTVVRTR